MSICIHSALSHSSANALDTLNSKWRCVFRGDVVEVWIAHVVAMWCRVERMECGAYGILHLSTAPRNLLQCQRPPPPLSPSLRHENEYLSLLHALLYICAENTTMAASGDAAGISHRDQGRRPGSLPRVLQCHEPPTLLCSMATPTSGADPEICVWRAGPSPSLLFLFTSLPLPFPCPSPLISFRSRPLKTARGFGGAVYAPPEGSATDPGRKRIWGTLKLSQSHWWQSF